MNEQEVKALAELILKAEYAMLIMPDGTRVALGQDIREAINDALNSYSKSYPS